MIVLSMNAGSASLKSEVFLIGKSRQDVFSPQNRLGCLNIEVTKCRGKKDLDEIEVESYAEATNISIKKLTQDRLIDFVVHRVVHGGPKYINPVMIDEDVLDEIEKASELAPIHNPSTLEIIELCKRKLPDAKHVAVFDTGFHETLPEDAYLYALPYQYFEKHGVRRFGFHGISHGYLVNRYSQLAAKELVNCNLITVHLGGGASVTAVKNGKSFRTSMGMTPLEGLMMGTRCGDLDPGIIPFLMGTGDVSISKLSEILYEESGLLGVSGISPDTRVLLKRSSEPRADLAINMFCQKVRQYIGAYLAEMVECDAIIFSGAMGENSPDIRSRILDPMSWLKIAYDDSTNLGAKNGYEGKICHHDSQIELWVIPSEEEAAMAASVVDLV